MYRTSPGACLVCGAAHTTCTAGDRGAAIIVAQLPARDAAARDPVPLVAETVQAALPPGQVTTGTYRGTKKR